jgi:RHS repeat-associated protein
MRTALHGCLHGFGGGSAKNASSHRVRWSAPWGPGGLYAALMTALVLLALMATSASAESLCTDTWTGPAEGSWATAANWSKATVPGSTDVACIGAGKTVAVNTSGNEAGVVQGEGALALSGGSLEVSNALESSTLHALSLEGGTLTGTATIAVTSSLTWSSGTMSGSGSTVIQPAASANLGAFTTRNLVGRKYINEGTTSFGQGRIAMAQGAEIVNSGTFIADSQNESPQIAFSPTEGPAPLILNTGLFEKLGGPGTTTIGVPFENHGKVKTVEGTLAFTGGGSSNGEAEWAAAKGYAIEFSSGSYLVHESTVSGSLVINGTVTLESTHNTGAQVAIPSGTLTVVGTETFSEVILENGTLTGAGTVQVSSALTWRSGIMSGSGTTVIQSSASADLGAFTTRTLTGRRYVNEGTTSFGQGRISMSQGAKIENSGTFIADSQNESPQIAFLPPEGPSPLIVNTGIFEKLGGPGTTTISVPFENRGTVRTVEGHLEITSPITGEQSTQYGGSENPSAPGQPHPTCGKPVSCATGNESATQTDFSIAGRGVGLDLSRTYNSQAAAASAHGPFGYGWTSSFSDHLIVEPSAKLATLVQADASTVPFTEGAGGSYTAPAWTQDTLTGSAEAGYTLTLPDQVKYHFAPSSGRLETVTDRNANTTTLTYGEGGRLEAITDPASRKITLTYNSEGLIESAKDPMGHVVKYAYEASNLTSVIEPGETEPRWRYKYDGSHQLTELIDGRGGKTTNEYNSAHQVVTQTDPLKHVLSFEYEAFDTKITNHATGAVTDEHFTSSYLPVAITHGFGTASASTESFSYDAAGNVLSTTDGNGHSTKYTYDAAANRTSKLDADKNETKWTYNATHDVETTTTPNGETTTIERDSHGNAIKISRPAPASTTQVSKYKYAVHGELESVEDPLKRVWKYEYDAKGNRTAEIDPEADKRTWAYNEDSQQTSTVSPRGVAAGGIKEAKYKTTIERDAQGRPTLVIAPLKHETKYTYDANGNLATVTDPEANKTTYTYDADNQPIKVEAPNKAITETGYDGAGRVTSQTDGNKHTTTYVRNALEQVSETIDPLARKTTKEYDAAGNLTSLTDAAKRTTSYKYDPANRLIEASYSDGKTPSASYEYDADGNRIKMIDGTGTSKYHYDQLDRLTESKDGHGAVSSYEYDLANQQTKITYPNGKAVTRAYDNAGRLKSTTDWLEHTSKFAYDADSNLTATVFPSATSNEDTYTYDEADSMSEVKMAKGAETLASLIYARNKDGGVTKATTVGLPGEAKPAFAYDENSRLSKGAGITYKYDAADNPTKLGTPTYTYDNASQLATGTGLKYTYDEVAQRTQVKPTSGPATSYGYDQAGNLTSVQRPKEGETPEIKDAYAYDGNGLRASQTIGASTSYLAWNLTASLPLILSDTTNSYIYGPGGLPVEQVNGEGSVLYLHHDQQGSTRLLSGSTGTTSATTTYDAYGNKLGSTGTATSALGYDGQYTSSDTGLIYLRARVYDPATAQFLTRDPLQAITRAPYSYVRDNPLSHADPRGLAWQVCVGGGVSIFGVTVEANACYVSTPGGDGLAGSVGAGTGPGLAANVHVGAGGSNAQTPNEYGGPFLNAGGSAQAGFGAYGGGFVGPGSSCNPVIVGGTAGLSAGIGAEASVTGSYTEVISF